MLQFHAWQLCSDSCESPLRSVDSVEKLVNLVAL